LKKFNKVKLQTKPFITRCIRWSV